MISTRTLAIWAALTTAAAAYLAVTSPLHAEELEVRGDRLWLPVEVAGRTVPGLLDSGAEVTVIDRATAATLGLAGDTEIEARGTGAGSTRAQLVENVELGVLGRKVTAPVVAIMDLSDVARRLTGGRLPLVIGREVFDAGRLVIDIAQGRIDWLAGDAEPQGQRLPLTAAHGIETIPVSFGGVSAQADFDLGNGTGVLISGALADRIDAQLAGFEPDGGIGGAEPRRVVYIPELTIAGRKFTHVRAHVSENMKVDANVGVGLLRDFVITTDFPGRAVWLAPR